MKSRGFTILELLVVIAIIGLLTAAILAVTSSARTRSRDARRLEDIREIEKALNLYYQANNYFPISPSQSSSTTLNGVDDVSVALTSSGFIPTVPEDPQAPTRAYRYITPANGSTYTIQFCQEDANGGPGLVIGCTNYRTP